MKVSTKGRYGLRFMLDLAGHSDSGNVKLKDIALRQAISEKYLWQIVTPLKTAGLISSTMGPGGGYTVAKAPTEITLRDILDVLEGGGGLVHCVTKPSACVRSDACVSREIWGEVNAKIAAVMDSVTLKDMVDKQKKMTSHEPLTYSI